MTEDDFETGYATKSNMTVAELHGLGLFAVPCRCGVEDCLGWAMISLENLASHVDLYLRNSEDK